MRILSSFLIGLLFGFGLVISQMANPAKIVGFLDLAGDWDPSLLVVMAAALATAALGYRLSRSLSKPAFEAAFQFPTNTEIDRPLLIGAGLFGVGWGMAGLCPGPGFIAVALGGLAPWLFIAAMIAGMAVQRLVKV